LKIDFIPNSGNFVFHYLDANALINVILNKKLWATNISYMNDEREGKIARNLIQEIIQRKRMLPFKVDEEFMFILERFISSMRFSFSSSFSERYDNLSMYRTYTPSSGGYCIGFEEDYLKSIPRTQYVACDYDATSHIEKLGEFLSVIYDSSQKIKEQYPDLNSRANKLINQYHKDLEDLSIGFKMSEFITEEESRIYTFSRPWEERKLRVSSKGNIIIPYVELELPDMETNVLICQGPNESPELANKGIEELHCMGMLSNSHQSKWKLHKLGPANSGFRNI
jgi:hypothetical protein